MRHTLLPWCRSLRTRRSRVRCCDCSAICTETLTDCLCEHTVTVTGAAGVCVGARRVRQNSHLHRREWGESAIEAMDVVAAAHENDGWSFVSLCCVPCVVSHVLCPMCCVPLSLLHCFVSHVVLRRRLPPVMGIVAVFGVVVRIPASCIVGTC